MSKKRTQAIAILVIAVIVFSIIAFLIPFEKGATFWVAYLAELLALALQIPIFKLAYDNADDLKSKVLGFPIFRVGYIYLGIQTIVSVILFALSGIISDFPVWIAAVVCILILGAALICSIAADIARNEITQIETSKAVDTQLMKSLRTKSQNLVNKTDDPNLKKQLEKLAESFRYSDPVSSSNTAEIERKLSDMLAELENVVRSGDIQNSLNLCGNVADTLNDRNEECRAGKV